MRTGGAEKKNKNKILSVGKRWDLKNRIQIRRGERACIKFGTRKSVNKRRLPREEES